MSDFWDESTRLRILEDHDTKGLNGDPNLSALTDFAAQLCEAPICLVSLVGADEQCFLAKTGVDIEATNRAVSFCQFAMVRDDLLIVGDAREDERFKNNPLVTGDFGLRFYAGAALRSAEGSPLGALCIIDRRPREGLTPLQEKGLRVLADQVASVLHASRRAQSGRLERQKLSDAVAVSENSFRILADTMPQMVWSAQPDGYHDYYNARWYEFTGVPAGSTDGEAWNGMFHPDDQELAWTRWRHSLGTGEPYEIEYRLRAASGEYRWTLGRALPMRGADNRIVRWFGTCTDIHDQKMLLEQRQLISQELSHRIKNIFSIVAGMISLSIRRFPDARQMGMELRERIMALGRAHDFVRPHSPASAPPGLEGSLQGMMRQLFAAYHDGSKARIEVHGDDLVVDDRAATPLALIFHELATNAVKYGALSTAEGRVAVQIRVENGELVVGWEEVGGPDIATPPTGKGFGSQLIELSGAMQLRAKIAREWPRCGLIMKMRVPLASLNRDPS